MVDFGWIFKNYLVVTNTGREVARCAVVSNCRVNNANVTPEALAKQRIGAGLFSNVDVDDPADWYFNIHYREENGQTGLQKGDSFVVCIQADNHYIGPVMPFLAMVTGNSSSLPDPMPLRSRTEMRVERVNGGTYTGIPLGNGTCSGFS